ncbi:uracil-DNA glycosylase [Sphingobium sp. DEHP117]|uniref:uracil-DNA glycosylase family protein n=1 Tax=Sphingobium sp. DEHP117 TaxID=2993436 RepID=UPI0027D49E74|nr:uracil-DNA glycosylase family protein [Sphingobium sp. DEHP117]MDQ4420646.1 uracil-DNA glycosylase [Sphingobium sp. DEHP117]
MTLLDAFVKPCAYALMRVEQYMGARATPLKAQIESTLAWWALAGVESAITDQPVNWLTPKQPSPRAAQTRVLPGDTGFPDRLDDFHAYLAQAQTLPEGSWPGPRIMPAGPPAPSLMILVHAPDALATKHGAPLEGAGMSLLARLLRAVGLEPTDCYFATLSLVTPPGGMIDGAVVESLVARMRHHIGLVAPKSLMLIGDQANRALRPTGGLDTSGNLLFVNHSGGMVPAVAIAHPRLMQGQPMAKAEAWRLLRELVKGWGQ